MHVLVQCRSQREEGAGGPRPPLPLVGGRSRAPRDGGGGRTREGIRAPLAPRSPTPPASRARAGCAPGGARRAPSPAPSPPPLPPLPRAPFLPRPPPRAGRRGRPDSCASLFLMFPLLSPLGPPSRGARASGLLTAGGTCLGCGGDGGGSISGLRALRGARVCLTSRRT